MRVNLLDFEAVTVVTIENRVFWVVMLCNLMSSVSEENILPPSLGAKRKLKMSSKHSEPGVV
jgi:hypothetical protein